MRLPLANSIGSRDASTDRDEKIVNGFSEIDDQVNKAVKRPAIAGASGGFVAIRGDTLDNQPAIRRNNFVFTVQPSSTGPGLPMSPSPVVSVKDVNGNVVTSYTSNITITLGPSNPNNGILSGTSVVAASAGMATFSNLIIDKLGSYTFIASGP